MQYKMPRGRPPWLRKAFILYSLNEYNYPTCIGLRPENSLGTFPEQGNISSQKELLELPYFS